MIGLGLTVRSLAGKQKDRGSIPLWLFSLSSNKEQVVPLVEFLYLVFTRTPGQSYSRGLRSLSLCLCHVFPALINSLVFRF